MTFHVFLFLLSVCLLLSLALLWHLGWLPLQPPHSAVASRRSPVPRLLKPSPSRLTALAVFSPPLPCQLEGQCLLLGVPGQR
jgi:hypothetical protein